MVEPFGGFGHGRSKMPLGSTDWPTYLFSPACFGWHSITTINRGITALQCGLLDALVSYALYPFFYNPFLVRTSPSATNTLDS